MKRSLWKAIVGLFAALFVLWASGIAPTAYNLIQNAGVSVAQRSTLNFVNGGCVDNAGANRTDCTISGGGGGTGGGLTVFSGSSITLLGTQFVAVGGGAAVSTTEASVEIQSPTAASVSNLSVQLSAGLGLGNSAVFTWRDGGSSQALTCTISGASATTCVDNTHSFSVAQGDEIDIEAVTTGTPSPATLVIASQFGTLANLNPTFTISNAASTGTTLNTLTKLTGAPSTAVISAITDTGGAVGITTAGAGTAGTATITTAGKISCVFDAATTAGDYVQISSTTAGNCHDTGAGTYPTSGQVLGRVLSTNGSGGTYTLDLFPSEIAASSGGGGGFIQTLAAPSSGSFSQINFNTGTGVVTTQTNNSSPVTSITVIQNDASSTGEIAGITKAKLAATFTVTMGFTQATGAGSGGGGGALGGLWLTDGSANNLFLCYQAGAYYLRIPVFSNFAGSFVGDVLGNAIPAVPSGPLMWVRVQETASNRIYSLSSDGTNFMRIFSEANTAHFTTSQYGFALENRGSAGQVSGTLYSFTETNP